MKVLILGAGGHGQTVADALLHIAAAKGAMQPLGFLDDTPALQGTSCQGLPVFGPLDALDRIAHDALILAIGDNRARRAIFLRLQGQGHRFATVIHPTAALALDVDVGAGTYIGARAVVGVATRIGANTIVNGSGGLGHHNRIGDHVHVGPGVLSTRDVRIGEGAMIGVGTRIVSGITVGQWSVVGAASLLTRDVPPGVVAYGSPARVVRRVDGG